MRRTYLVVAVGGLLACGALFTWRWWHEEEKTAASFLDESIAKLQTAKSAVPEPSLPPVAGLDLSRITFDESGAVAPAAEERTARLTIDPELQRTALALMAARHLPEASVVMIDVATGNLIVYASRVEHGDEAAPRDLCAEATAPSASVFKIITGSTLVEEAHLGADTRECYAGGGSERLTPADLADDPKRDKWCVTLAHAMGRSVNAVFAKLAQRHLKPNALESMAKRWGFGQPVPFDVPVQPSAVTIPDEPLEFARTAAGFWNTTLSPLQAAWISATIARGGEAIRPKIVREVRGKDGEVVYTAPPSPVVRRVIKAETARELTTMMDATVAEGTSFRAFHDERGRPFLPNIEIAGKTGTLTDQAQQRFYTWFTGFAPSTPGGDARQVAIAALVVNGPVWQIKANVLARDMLRAYFASQNVANVSKPQPIARHHAAHPGHAEPKKTMN